MKKELLEYLIRECVHEILTQVNEKTLPTGKYVDDMIKEQEDDTKGAPAPPVGGQGTADTPEIPVDKQKPEDEPEEPETPETPEAPPPSAELKGVVLVNPKDKARLQKVPLKLSDDASLERNLYRIGSTLAGSRVKTALSTTRMVKDALKNPNTTTYLYIGKYDPNSDELFLMADKSLQVAKDASVSPGEITGAPVSPLPSVDYVPLQAKSPEQRFTGMSPRHGIDENLKKVIKGMIHEILTK